MLKNHNHSHPAAAQWGGKLRKGQASAVDWSRGSSKLNIAPLTCSSSTQTPFRQSFFGFQKRQHEEQQFYPANNFIFYRACAGDEGLRACGHHGCVMESSRTLLSGQDRMNFPESSHRSADFSQGSREMLPPWGI